MTGWAERRLCAFDTETTGVDPETARIVTATVAFLGAGTREVRSWLVNPGVPIPAEATAVHGVTDERVRVDGAEPFGAVRDIADALQTAWDDGLPVVAYNAPYDLTVLDRELGRHAAGSVAHLVGPVLDPLVIDRAMDPYRKGSRKLVDACAHYRVRLDAAHDSASDAIAAARLAWRLAQVYPELDMTLDDLTVAQADWHLQWAARFTDYLRSTGSAEVIDPAWPIRAARVAA